MTQTQTPIDKDIQAKVKILLAVPTYILRHAYTYAECESIKTGRNIHPQEIIRRVLGEWWEKDTNTIIKGAA